MLRQFIEKMDYLIVLVLNQGSSWFACLPWFLLHQHLGKISSTWVSSLSVSDSKVLGQFSCSDTLVTSSPHTTRTSSARLTLWIEALRASSSVFMLLRPLLPQVISGESIFALRLLPHDKWGGVSLSALVPQDLLTCAPTNRVSSILLPRRGTEPALLSSVAGWGKRHKLLIIILTF